MEAAAGEKVFTEQDKLDVLQTYCDSNQSLTKLDLTSAVVTDELLVKILITHQHTLTDLNMTNISGPTYKTNVLLDAANVHFPNLTTVKLTSMELLMNSIASKEELDRDLPVFTSRCPNVKQLLFPKIQKNFSNDEDEASVNAILSKILEPLHQLETLDLSYWTKVGDLRCIQPLHHSLTSLILYDVPDLCHAVSTITQMTELTHLDISQSQRKTGIYPQPGSTLHQIVTCLPKLTHLDISSTNLAEQKSDDDCSTGKKKKPVRSAIVGLQSLEKPLAFLGLFNCDSACHLHKIPAETVAGDANEDQLIKALQMYKERSGLLELVLDESNHLYQMGNSNPYVFGSTTPFVKHTETLSLVLDAMERYSSDSKIQITGSSSLFYIMRKAEMDCDTKTRFVNTLLSAMELHMEQKNLITNCCHLLCQLRISQNILFDYNRLAALLVTLLQQNDLNTLTQRMCVCLLNSIACNVKGDQKAELCSFGAIEMILDQISRKHSAKTCDDVMEVGWGFLWNISDGTPVNCARFLDAKGLELFQKCYETFKTERNLVRNMMGVLANIAEFDELRCQLMKDDYVNIFFKLLEAQNESLMINYNVAVVLASLVSDGVWRVDLTISRDEVMKSIVKATNRWDLTTRRSIQYYSLRPILRLLPIYHSYASQQWAVWALANLTTTDGERYCTMVRDEGGVEMLEDLVSITTDEIRALGYIVLDNVQDFENRKKLEALDITTQQNDEESIQIEGEDN